jgi:hypothetical protein
VATTIEDLERSIQALREEVEELKKRDAVGHRLRSDVPSAAAGSGSSIEQLEREIGGLRADFEALVRRQPSGHNITPDRFAGRYTDDPDWAAIHDAIEARRRVPAGEPE